MIKTWMMKGFLTPYSTEYTTPGTQTVSIPANATTVTVECIGAGWVGGYSGGDSIGGGGGAYSKATSYSLSGLSGIYISVPAVGSTDSFARENGVAGTVICLAKSGTSPTGGAAAAGTGDVKYSGGDGAALLTTETRGGGGAAGPAANGSNAVDATGGATGGAPGGDGGSGTSAGAAVGHNYGGGGGVYSAAFNGAQGYIKLSWA